MDSHKSKVKLVLFLFLLFLGIGCSESTSTEEPPAELLSITHISPLTASCGDTLFISGTQFGFQRNDVEVLLNGDPLRIISINNREIKAEVSEKHQSGQIKINKDQKSITYTDHIDIEVLDSLIIHGIIPEQGFLGDEILIEGENFNLTPSKNVVELDGTEFNVLSSTSTELKVEVPFVINKRGKLQVASNCRESQSGNEFWVNTSVGSWTPFFSGWYHDSAPEESEHFIVFSDRSSQEMRKQIADEAEVSFLDLKSIINYQDGEFNYLPEYESEKIHIMADYAQQSHWGLAYRDGFIIRAKDSPLYNGQDKRWSRVFQHEMAHVFEFLLIGKYAYRLSNTVWMREGFGNYGARNHAIQTLEDMNNWRSERSSLPGGGNPIAIRVWADFPQDVLDAGGGATTQWYRMFELSVRYLLDPEGHGKTIQDLKNYYDDLGNGIPYHIAFESNFDLNMDDFQENYWSLMEAYLQEK